MLVYDAKQVGLLALTASDNDDDNDELQDIGCGIGGPARHIASLSEAKVIGLNINEYQLARARTLSEKAKLDHLCSFVKVNER